MVAVASPAISEAEALPRKTEGEADAVPHHGQGTTHAEHAGARATLRHSLTTLASIVLWRRRIWQEWWSHLRGRLREREGQREASRFFNYKQSLKGDVTLLALKMIILKFSILFFLLKFK